MTAVAVEMTPTTRLQHANQSPLHSRGSGQSLLIEAVMRSAGSSRQGSVHSQPGSPAAGYPGWMTAKTSQDGMVMSRAASEIMSPKQPTTSQSAPERALSRSSGASHAGSDTRRSAAYTGSVKSAERRSTGASRMSISVGEMLSPSDTHRTRPPQQHEQTSPVTSPSSPNRMAQGGESDAEKPQKLVSL